MCWERQETNKPCGSICEPGRSSVVIHAHVPEHPLEVVIPVRGDGNGEVRGVRQRRTGGGGLRPAMQRAVSIGKRKRGAAVVVGGGQVVPFRSEERRVGKECR